MSSTRLIGAVALSVCAGLALTTANAEIFQRVSGDPSREHAFSIANTSDGGYVTAGFRDSAPPGGAPDEDVLITKHKPDGSIEWQRLWRGPGRDIAYSVQQTFDDGYIVAAESTSSGVPGFELLLIRLDAFGAPVWNNFYSGSFMSDPIHSPHPGVALDQGFEGAIYVTGNLAGLPLILAVGPGGGLFWQAVYADPAGPDGVFKYAFTDIKHDRIDNTLVVSGSAIRPNFGQPGAGDAQDAFLMRTGPGGMPAWSWIYDFPFDLFPDDGDNVRESGDGLDIGPNGDIVLNGRTDFGGPADPVGTHLIGTDRAGIPTWSSEYVALSPTGLFGRAATAYAAVRFDDHFRIVQAGRIVDPSGMTQAWVSLTAFGGAPIWFWEYGRDGNNASLGESVVPVPEDCGYAMAGQYRFVPPIAPFARGESYLVKNNDDGQTGCLERRWDLAPQFEARRLEAPIQPQYRQEWFPAENLLAAVEASELVFCTDPDCVPGSPCPCDLDNNNILDLNDINTFIACFTGMLPCGDLAPPAGVWDLADVGAFIACFTAGCP